MASQEETTTSPEKILPKVNEETVRQEVAANVKFCFKLGTPIDDMYESLKKVYDTSHICFAKDWYNKFAEGMEDIYEVCREKQYAEWHIPGNIKEIINIIREIVNTNPNVTVSMLAAELDLKNKQVYAILPHISKTHYFDRIVPSELTKEQKKARVAYCVDILKMCQRESEFYTKIVTGHVMWYLPIQCETAPDVISERRCMKDPCIPSRKGQMLIIYFYDSKGIIYEKFITDPGKTGITLNDKFYLEIMEGMLRRLYRSRPEYEQPGSWYLLLEHSPFHDTIIKRQFLAKRQICVINVPAYSPELSPCDYFMAWFIQAERLKQKENWSIEGLVKHPVLLSQSLMELEKRAEEYLGLPETISYFYYFKPSIPLDGTE